jgi:hypothetical protein
MITIFTSPCSTTTQISLICFWGIFFAKLSKAQNWEKEKKRKPVIQSINH